VNERFYNGYFLRLPFFIELSMFGFHLVVVMSNFSGSIF
jgi:hypothetical protein